MNTRYPAMIGAVAGARVSLPPQGALSDRRRPADCVALGVWLAAEVPRLEALVVSVEMLAYGGLIASRTTGDPAAAALARLEVLRAVKAAHPRLPIYAFGVVTRVSSANDALEEPAYWAEYGERICALSQLLDRRGRGHPVEDELARLEAAVPTAHRRDLLARRLRNHLVNLGALALLEDGTLDLLVLSSDDTSPFGLPSREKGWLAWWGQLLSQQTLPWSTSERSERTPGLLMYPGADEVACVLVARLLNERAGVAPSVAVSYAPPAASCNVAAYEDGPISLTVERQILAGGGRVATGDADLWLGVSAPLDRCGEWEPAHAAEERAVRQEALAALVAEARRQVGAGRAAALADVAYPNGADPALAELMLERLELPALAAYGAWNTAGNTVGSVVAQAFAGRLCAGAEGRAAHERLLLHRLLEDWGYQHLVRAEVRGWLRETTGHQDPHTPETVGAVCLRIEAGLSAALERLPGLAGRYRLAPGSVRLPWGRTFEVDFDLIAT